MKKKALIITSISISIIVIFVFLFVYFTIRNSKDCSQLVIDTYELASGIDIPKQTNSECYYDENDHIRVGIYSINNIEISNFINKYRLVKIDFNTKNILWSYNYLLKNNAVLPDSSGNLFRVTGDNKRNKWQCLIDINTGKMWFEIKWI